jgi:hypothetical protein
MTNCCGCGSGYTAQLSIVESIIVGNNGVLCAGQTLNLYATYITNATYSWTGPNGFSSTLQNPSITGVQATNGGTYCLTVASQGNLQTQVCTLVGYSSPCDGIPDWWRAQYFGSTNVTTTNCATCYPDGNGYNNLQDYNFGLNPTNSASYPTNVPPYMAAWWKFDEGSGTITADSSGNGNDGTLVNNPTWVTGVFSNALQFNPASIQEVRVQPSRAVTGTFTVTAWVLPERPTAKMNLVSTRANAASTFDLKLQGGNQIYGDIGSGGSWIETSAAVTYNYTTGVWYHIAYVVTPTNFSVYANGAYVGGGSYEASTPVLCDADYGTDLTIGNIGNGTELFSGTIDDVRIYDRALSSNDVVALYNTDTVGDGIPNWWRQQYFGTGSTTNSQSCASCDPEGDGFTNLQEFQAGSDPTNANSTPLTQPPGPSQTNLFFYDNLGRLAVVVATNGTDAAFYSYDAVGNITAISRQTIGLLNLFEFSPTTGSGSQLITLQGTGFSPTLINNTVLIGSVAATVVSATANQLQVRVPTNAVSGLISVSTPFGVFTNSATFNVLVSVSVSPSSVTLSGTATQQFTAVVHGTANQNVNWYIDGWIPAGSSSQFGLISTNGVYTAPISPPASGFVTIHARSVVATSPLEDGVATVTLTSALGPIVSPVISVQPGLSVNIGPIVSPLISGQSTTASVSGPIVSPLISVGESE